MIQDLEVVLASSAHLVKWIPKSSRRACAAGRSNILNAIVSTPANILPWIDLLLFSKYTLAVPQNSASRAKAVSESITRRCRDLASLSTLARLAALRKELQKPLTARQVRSKTLATPEEILARRVMLKLEEGNFRGAVDAVRSEETLAPPSRNTLEALRTKHPSEPPDRRPFKLPEAGQAGLDFDITAVRRAVASFPHGSAGGPDGLSPQHLKDMLRADRAN